jgi:hypothetical protein
MKKLISQFKQDVMEDDCWVDYVSGWISFEDKQTKHLYCLEWYFFSAQSLSSFSFDWTVLVRSSAYAIFYQMFSS